MSKPSTRVPFLYGTLLSSTLALGLITSGASFANTSGNFAEKISGLSQQLTVENAVKLAKTVTDILTNYDPQDVKELPQRSGKDFTPGADYQGNRANDDFQKVKNILLRQVYFDHRTTLYCGYPFEKNKDVDLPRGFVAPEHKERASRIEWEHVVPAEHFGQSFTEWSQGVDACKRPNGHYYKGRKCAEDRNQEYRYMQADMYNLFPAVGAVNAVRSNYPYRILENVPHTFGTCEMKVAGNYAEPPERSRGEISRAMLYMDATYPAHYQMGDRVRKMVEEWNRTYPVTAWECTRAARIESLQGNANRFVKEACQKAGLPYKTR